ncbi:M-phase phosphoprotein 8 isoform X2 [Hyalella azteca]|uniref:M-phase phosphoprotein 8 isoform X2 n=1 Tax=Hyalella azteca TaxID=294128 RepID=A0A8B7NFR2_HYAAZ|nr:M-phase phosphoprotein 8 isoform X2 [Hyalella azteca]
MAAQQKMDRVESGSARSPVVGEEGVFEVDRVIDIMWRDDWESGAGGPLYRVRWKGFPPIEDTWEPIDNFTLETRKTVRRFVRSYKKMQETERKLRRSVMGDSADVECRHVNILSREVKCIQSMRCDTHRQPALWFYLVAWKGLGPEDATWESEVYLRHASDLILQYRTSHPLTQGRNSISSGLSPPSSTPSDPTKLLLDGPTPRKQKEKLVFVNDLIDDKIRYEPKSSTKTTPKDRIVISKKASTSRTLNTCEKVNRTNSTKKIATDCQNYDMKAKQSEFHCLPGKSSTSAELHGKKVSTRKLCETDKAIKCKTSSHKQRTAAPSKISGNLDNFEQCDQVDGLSSDSENDKNPRREKSHFRRLILPDDSTDSEVGSDQGLRSYKNKYIKDRKMEEKKRRKDLMAKRKLHDLNVNHHKRTYIRGRAKHLPKIVTTQDSFSTDTTRAKSSPIVKPSISGTSDPTKTKEESSKRTRNLHLMQKLENIFGYDTDSEDLTLSPASFCSSSGNVSFQGKSSEKFLEWSTQCPELPSAGHSSPLTCKLDEDSFKSPSFNTQDNCAIVEKSRGLAVNSGVDGKGSLQVDGAETAMEVLLSGLPDYDPIRRMETFALETSHSYLLTEEDFISAIEDGDYNTALQYLECSQRSLPRLPYASMLIAAQRQGRRDVAQLLVAAAIESSHDRRDWQHHWLPAVEEAARQGDLNTLMMLEQLIRSPTYLFSISDEEDTSQLAQTQATLERDKMLSAVRWSGLHNAERAAQKHIIAALCKNIIF